MIDLAMRLPKIITVVSVIIFAASLTQKCFYTEVHIPKPPPAGWYLLLIGLIGVFGGYFEWLANPVLLAAWVFSFAGKNKAALLGILSSAFMVAFLFRHAMIASEAPTYEKIIGYGAGYWLWLTSAGLVIVSGAAGLMTQRQRPLRSTRERFRSQSPPS
jgi:hypothetical protein